MLLSHKHRFVYVRIPRTASSSMVEALTRGVADIEQIHQLPTPISALHGYDDYQAFAFIRDPWRRALSLYAYFVRRRRLPTPQGFVEFLANPPEDAQWIVGRQLMDQQVDYISGNRHVEIGRFERLEDDFRAICARLGLGDLELRHRNSAAQLSMKEYYNDTALALVSQLFPTDIATLGYPEPTI
jgi:hypothetical protein